MAAEKKALALLSDVDKATYNEKNLFYQIAPEMFEKINQKIDNKSGAQKTLLLYLIFQRQNGDFHPAEATILKACNFDHKRYNTARDALIERGFLEYEPYKYLKIIYKKIME